DWDRPGTPDEVAGRDDQERDRETQPGTPPPAPSRLCVPVHAVPSSRKANNPAPDFLGRKTRTRTRSDRSVAYASAGSRAPVRSTGVLPSGTGADRQSIVSRIHLNRRRSP